MLRSFSDGEFDGAREMSLGFASTTCLAPEGHKQHLMIRESMVATRSLPHGESDKAHEMEVDTCSPTKSPAVHYQEADKDTVVSDSEDNGN